MTCIVNQHIRIKRRLLNRSQLKHDKHNNIQNTPPELRQESRIYR